MDKYYIDSEMKKVNNAGVKAPQDIAELCKQLGLKKISMPMFVTTKFKLYEKLWLLFVCSYNWIKVKNSITQGSTVLYQHPLYGVRVAVRFVPYIKKRKNCKFIAVIHDLESLRKGVHGGVVNNEKTNDLADNNLLKNCDAVICHNNYMKDYLISQGLDANKIVCLEIFDYLNDFVRVQPSKSSKPSVAIAGNLAIGKSPYIYDIFGTEGDKNKNLCVHLYGSKYNEEINKNKNMIYHGSFEPEELAKHLEGDFGLVWDGTSAETCEGNTGDYLKYNNPHKTSLYLSSSMPVVVWSKAAIADFVLKNKVGITVDSLYELDEKIASISDDEYELMRKNASIIGEKLRNGYYFKNALEKCFDLLENNKE